MAGIRNTEPIAELKKQFPKVHAELLEIFARLEAHYRDMCDTEFTIEQGKLWMLQTRVGKRTGAAALKMAVDMVRAERPRHLQGRGRVAHHRGPPRLRAAPAVRRLRLHGLGQGPRRQPGRGGGPRSTSPPTTPPRRPSAARR